MILNIILWYPSSKAKEVLSEVSKLPKPPNFVKKWQFLQTAEGKAGIKHYNIIYIEKGKGDEAIVDISKMLWPILDKEYVEAKIEVLTSARDALKILSK